MQPVWESADVGFRVLLKGMPAAHRGCYAEMLRWLRVPLSRCCFHSTVSVRRLGLAGLLSLGGNFSTGQEPGAITISNLVQVKRCQMKCDFDILV